MTSTVDSCTKPRSSFLYHRIGMPVWRNAGDSFTCSHSPWRLTTGNIVPLGMSTSTIDPDDASAFTSACVCRSGTRMYSWAAATPGATTMTVATTNERHVMAITSSASAHPPSA